MGSFINGESAQIVIGGKAQYEIWDIQSRSSVRITKDICTDDSADGNATAVWCTCSVGNVLALACEDKVLRLYDVTTWKEIYSKQYELKPTSLRLTPDLKYLAIAGETGEQCVVLKITTLGSLFVYLVIIAVGWD